MLVKCPYCGSTAQVKRELAVPSESRNGEIISIHYKCGCGCHFSKEFQFVETVIEYVEDLKRGKKNV